MKQQVTRKQNKNITKQNHSKSQYETHGAGIAKGISGEEISTKKIQCALEKHQVMLDQKIKGDALYKKSYSQKQSVQRQIEVSQPGDPKEQEADAISEKVMRQDDETIEISPQSSVKNTEQLAAKRENSNSITVSEKTESYINNLHGGEPMRKQDQQFFGNRFGSDFSGVRIHTDAAAANSAKDINAKAYTKGNNVVFAKGEYQPNTSEGKKLMAHELVHVRQQGNLILRKDKKKNNVKTVYVDNGGSDLAGQICCLYSDEDGNLHSKIYIKYYHRSYSEWLEFLDTCAYVAEKQLELNAYMAASIDRLDKTLSTFKKFQPWKNVFISGKYHGFKYLKKSSMEKGALTLLRTMLYSDSMDLHGEISGHWKQHIGATTAFKYNLFSLFFTYYIQKVFSQLEKEEIERLTINSSLDKRGTAPTAFKTLRAFDVKNFARETERAKGYRLLINASVFQAFRVLKKSLSIPIQENKTLREDITERYMFELGRLTGRGIKILIDKELTLVDRIGDYGAAVASILSAVIFKNASVGTGVGIVAGYIIDIITDNWKSDQSGEIKDIDEKCKKAVNMIMKKYVKEKDDYKRGARRIFLRSLLKSFQKGILRVI